MNFKILLLVVLAGVVYAGVILTHKRVDERAQPAAPTDDESYDASHLVNTLIRSGERVLPAVKSELINRGSEGKGLVDLLPDAGEPWRQRLKTIMEAPPSDDGSMRVAAPRGLQGKPPRSLVVRRDGIGSTWVTLFEGQRLLASFQAAVNVAVPFPEGIDFREGATYRLAVAHAEGAAPIAEEVFTMITPEQRDALRRRLSILRRHVHEVRARVFMQASVAMSMKLYDDAWALLFERLPKDPAEMRETGLLERLVFLSWHRRNFAHMARVRQGLLALRQAGGQPR